MNEEMMEDIKELRGENVGTLAVELSKYSLPDYDILQLGTYKIIGYKQIGKEQVYYARSGPFLKEQPIPDELYDSIIKVRRPLYAALGVTEDEEELVAFFTADKVTDMNRVPNKDGIRFSKTSSGVIVSCMDGRNL